MTISVQAEIITFSKYEKIKAVDINSNLAELKHDAYLNNVYIATNPVSKGASIDSSWWSSFSNLGNYIDSLYTPVVSDLIISSSKVNQVYSDLASLISGYNKDKLVTCVAFDPGETSQMCEALIDVRTPITGAYFNTSSHYYIRHCSNDTYFMWNGDNIKWFGNGTTSSWTSGNTTYYQGAWGGLVSGCNSYGIYKVETTVGEPGFIFNNGFQDFCMGLTEAQCLSLESPSGKFAYTGVTNYCSGADPVFCEQHAVYDNGTCIGMSEGGCFAMGAPILPEIAVACANLNESQCLLINGLWDDPSCFIQGDDSTFEEQLSIDCVDAGGFIQGQHMLCENITESCNGYSDGIDCFSMNNIHCKQLGGE